MEAAYSFRMVADEDLMQLSKCFKEVFGRTLSPEYYKWKYQHNTTYSSFIVLDGENLVGHVGYSVVKYTYGGNDFLVARRHSSFIRKKYRSKGLFGKLLQFSTSTIYSSGVKMIVGYPNISNLSATLSGRRTVPFIQIPMLRRKAVRPKAFIDGQNPLCGLSMVYNIQSLKHNLLCFDLFSHEQDFLSIKKDYQYIQKRYMQEPNSSYFFYDNGRSLAILKYVNFSNEPTIAIMDLIGLNSDLANNISEMHSILPASCNIISICNFSNNALIRSYLKSNFLFDKPIFNLTLLPSESDDYMKTFLNNKEVFTANLGDGDAI